MKKLLSLLLAALLLPLTAGALDLQPNQLLMGHYLTDDLATTGWGSTILEGLATVATDITPDELARYKGGDIVAFRVGLTLSTPISRVFVIPVMPDGTVLTNQMTEWPCEASSKGWNMIELATPYTINVPEGYSLRIGFDYEQATKFVKPLSLVRVGTNYQTYHLVGDEWRKLVLASKGNLSLQCVVENDHFPQYVIRVNDLVLDHSLAQVGTTFAYSFDTYDLGATGVPAGGCTYEIAIDGHVIETLTNPVALTDQGITMEGSFSTAALAAGNHTFTVTPVMVNGDILENSTVFEVHFSLYDYGFERQMRLVEQFTSTNCIHCPKGTAALQALSDLRGDIAWVAVHQDMNAPDVFKTLQGDTIRQLQGINGYPEGTFDRTAGVAAAGQVYAVLTYDNAQQGANYFSSFLDYVDQLMPAWATVFINSAFDDNTRKATVTVNGDLAPGFDGLMGEDSKLTVYITEDGLLEPQYNSGVWVDDYIHNNVLRLALGSAMGVNIHKVGDNKYKNEFTVDIPSDWNAENMNIVAFISRPLGNDLSDIYVTNCNMRAFGISDELELIRGDVDGDGEVTINDVTQLINCLLSKAEPANPDGADCDLDGIRSINDVTALINFLLSHNWPE